VRRQRLFFILLFLAGLGVGAFYFSDFVSRQHPTLGNKLTARLLAYVAVAVIIQLCAHVLRAYKSRLLINKMRPSKTSTLFRGLSIGFLFNALLPFRLGELVRAFYVGDELAISKTAVFVSVIIERIIDGFILGICFISAAFVVKGDFPAAFSTLNKIGVGLLVLSSLLTVAIHIIRSESKIILKTVHSISGLFNDTISNRLRFMSWSGIYGARLMLSDRKAFVKYLALSIAMWGLYFGSTAFVAIAFFQSIGAMKLWYTVQATYAGVSAPAGPGYIGTFQILVSHLLRRIDLMSVGGFSILAWLITVVPISLIGLAVLTKQRFSEKQKTPKQHMLINKLYREQNVTNELAHFLDAYFKGEKLNQILTHAEQENKFKLIRSFRGGSNAHTMLVWQDEGMRIKKIALLQYAEKLEAQARWLVEHAGLDHIPAVIGQEKTAHHYYFDLAYHEEFYPFYDYIHSHSAAESFKILTRIIKFMDKSVYKELPARDGRQKVVRYINEKVLGKVNDTASMSNVVSSLMAYDKLIINGTSYHNLLQVIDKIQRSKIAMKDLSSYSESPIHGDLTVDNLIVNDKADFLVLDPNDENQVSSKIVDLAKLYQSLDIGYEFLIQLEQCSIKDNHINYEDSKSHKYAELFSLFDTELKKKLPAKDYRTILFHEGVHYCRMLTYRANINPDTVAVFYATAVKLFNEFLKQYEKEA
jgi:uncharacterized protein (TIRG00374 family)